MTQSIVTAQPSDTAAVSAILKEAADWCMAQGVPLWKADELAPEHIAKEIQDQLFHMVLDEGGIPFAVFKLQWSDTLYWPEFPVDEAAYIHRIAVKRSHAGRGVTPVILDWAVEQARAKKLKYLRLDTEASRIRLRAVYERFGFKLHSEKQVGPYFVARYEYAL